MKKKIHKKICLLGYGYASLIAYHKLLERYNASDIVILKKSSRNHFLTIQHHEIEFSPLPIFPVLESELYLSDLFKNIPKQKPIRVRYTDVANFDFREHTIGENSLADFMISNESINKWLCLGLKQWSEKMLTKPYKQVRSKIERHYLSKNKATRIGYINGLSLFNLAIQKIEPNIIQYSDIEKIDYLKKEVITNEIIINYDHLISTIHLPELLSLCQKPSAYNFESIPAYFFYYTFDGEMEENEVVYDCDYNSSILRCISVTDSLLLVQLQAHKYGEVQEKAIQLRIKEIVPEIKELKYLRDLYAPTSYPTENIEDETTLENIAILKENNILPFGRFGQWEYSDLHEIEWCSLP
ncbi:hypothetical protein FEE95_01865 [Maribacter algarum]|uniref:Uncharacterized protein n=1 Tax=Maribacter algarum (ex Zhang et al. 2020) TaxID=2578118 RepID=A0A5S3PY29_9FLAO|nr:hypothetical protein [Maribacter algarum]TMM58197.1 hypothetical protein FEE95_01865 [Maribacter algarum]